MQKIGVALSGGGIRATIFHLGVFKFLAENGMMENVARISSVSGASLCVGLVLGRNGLKWPSSKDYAERILPDLRGLLLKKDVQAAALLRLPVHPEYWNQKVRLLARMIETQWGIQGKLADLPNKPAWEINCTTFETGKNFRFEKRWMGDYRIGYVRDPDFSLATAMATSAGFPVFIGAYRMKIRDYAWLKEKKSSETLEPQGKYYHLWDGGVYDNLGLEALYKIGKGLAAGLDFLVVSNASGGGGRGKYRGALGSAANLKRLLDIALDQVEALRSRDVFTRVIEAGRGVYVHIGKSAADIVGDGGIEKKAGAALIAECISAQDAQRVKEYPTTLRRPTEADFDLILRHGYENAKCNFARSHTGH